MRSFISMTSLWKRGLPVSSSAITQPAAHMSTGVPYFSTCSSTSGGRYLGQRLHVGLS
ncbi:hypothetical protein DPMN_176991 [Dreissena polymorpha]|uniref:Uncharacterized protein n=1 Tax=Dreissena polymorpha TaxID=45954 RepID=A0A9D4EB93_DREPO|nr:hypothetical protein DPMN_176991 [Dreissena polymorpha]